MFFDGWRNKWNLLWARLLGRVATPIDLQPLLVDEPDEPVIRVHKQRRAPDPHLRDILERLPECRRLIKKLKSCDADAYAYHARMGARLICEKDKVPGDELLPSFREALPSSGMVYTLYPLMDDRVPASFLYFTKWSKSPHVVTPRRFEALYEVTCVYIFKEKPFLVNFHVAVVDGCPVVLKERTARTVSLPRNKKHGRGSFTRIETDYPGALKDMLADNKERVGSVQELGSLLFCLVANFFAVSTRGFQVRAERGGVSVAFNVEIGRTAQFFKNRDVTALASDGKRKRIFHHVVAHTRANGTAVKAHYKGLRKFSWEGNAVVVTPPEKTVLSWQAPSIDPADIDDNEPTLNSAETATFVRRVLEA